MHWQQEKFQLWANCFTRRSMVSKQILIEVWLAILRCSDPIHTSGACQCYPFTVFSGFNSIIQLRERIFAINFYTYRRSFITVMNHNSNYFLLMCARFGLWLNWRRNGNKPFSTTKWCTLFCIRCSLSSARKNEVQFAARIIWYTNRGNRYF